jgi:large subunit ribosomal protein L15
VVVVGEGEIDHPLTVTAHRVSAAARAKIEAVGGVVELLPWTRGGYHTR